MSALYKITCKVEFDAGHRVLGHKGNCKFLHGHRYVLQVQILSSNLDELGMVVDFGDMKKIIKGWIDKNFDHNLILSVDDKNLGNAVEKATHQKIYYMNQNPTAENIAIHLKRDILPKLFIKHPVKIGDVILAETPNFSTQV